MRPSKAGGWRTVVFKERTGGVVYGLYGDQGGGRPLGQIDVGGERNAVGSAALPLNAWSHLAATFDGAAVRLFVNGVQAGSLSFSGSMAASTGVLRLGGNGVWGEWFAGLIDEVRVYSRALSATEIQQDMQTPVGGSRHPTGGHDSAVGAVRPCWLDHGRFGDAELDGGVRQRRCRPLQRAPVDDGRFHAGDRQPGRPAHGHEPTPTRASPRYLLLPGDGRGRGRQRQRSVAELAVTVPPPPDTTPPSAPSGLTASTAVGSATVSWTAATDNVGVVRYNVHRSTTAGFTPATANRVGQPIGTSHTDSGLAAGTYYYRVTAEDAVGNVSSPSAQLTASGPRQPPPPAGGRWPRTG